MKCHVRSWIAIVVVTSVCGLAQAEPSDMLIIRHAEKPDDDSIHLSPRGQRRAEALPRLFMKSAYRPDPFPKPDFIFATKKSNHSNRPVETVTPLAQVLNLDIHARFEDDEVKELATELLTNPRYAGKIVLVCWHHGKIPKLARKLNAENVPDNWCDDVFDKVWVITYKDGEGTLKKRDQDLALGSVQLGPPSRLFTNPEHMSKGSRAPAVASTPSTEPQIGARATSPVVFQMSSSTV